MTCAFWHQNTFTFNKPAPLGAKILRAFHWKRSINSCIWFNKLLTNLTSLHQHHLQYTSTYLSFIHIFKMAWLIVKNSAQTSFRFSPRLSRSPPATLCQCGLVSHNLKGLHLSSVNFLKIYYCLKRLWFILKLFNLGVGKNKLYCCN